jgi:hypothetical protein
LGRVAIPTSRPVLRAGRAFVVWDYHLGAGDGGPGFDACDIDPGEAALDCEAIL